MFIQNGKKLGIFNAQNIFWSTKNFKTIIRFDTTFTPWMTNNFLSYT